MKIKALVSSGFLCLFIGCGNSTNNSSLPSLQDALKTCQTSTACPNLTPQQLQANCAALQKTDITVDGKPLPAACNNAISVTDLLCYPVNCGLDTSAALTALANCLTQYQNQLNAVCPNN
jgi:hypothetical protein